MNTLLSPFSSGYVRRPRLSVEAMVTVAVSHHYLLPFIPAEPCLCLDIDAGTGLDAANLVELGHSVVAVDTLKSLKLVADNIKGLSWIDDKFPELNTVKALGKKFNIILTTYATKAECATQKVTHVDYLDLAANTLKTLLARDGKIGLKLKMESSNESVFSTTLEELVHSLDMAGLTVLDISPTYVRVTTKPDDVWVYVVAGHAD